MFQSRTNTCGELRLENVGQKVTLVGWLDSVREVSSALVFVVLRDFYGTTQIVAEQEDIIRQIRGITRESTISVTGVVRERDSRNPKQATGDIEIVPGIYVRFILTGGTDGGAPGAQILFSDNFPAAFSADDAASICGIILDCIS